ncbi:MAG: aminomethyl-transferring glycine dehydrogenase subunit GcvPA [Anaerolineae bacterium]
MNYIPNTDRDRKLMLKVIGVDSVEELFADIPQEKRFPNLDLPEPLSEMEVARLINQMAERNADLGHHPCFLGAGAYHHFIPAVVGHLLSRGEFYTAYTPYQPEVSQGTLTAIYEYQTMVCQLTGMDVANASMYDGASALAEAALMAARITRRDKVVVSSAVHPEYRDVVRTYTQGIGLEIKEAGYRREDSGQTDLDQVGELVDEETACFMVQHPNFFGCLENLAGAVEIAHQKGALVAVCVDPIALGMLKPPGDYGADIVVGEGQGLGTPLSFGGPYLGLLACRQEYVRQLPGRIAGMTTDTEGRRGFVLTLQPREQHIRREKATSNICTNQALVALAATIYLGAMGKRGMRQVAELCYHKAHYAAERIAALDGFQLLFQAPFFKEFAVRTPQPPNEVNARLLQQGVIGGYDLSRTYPELGDAILFCVTEMNPRDEIDKLEKTLRVLRNP